MRHGIAIVALAVTASGCFGGSSGAPGSSSVTTGGSGLATGPPQLMVTYWTGEPKRTRAGVAATCPARAQCAVVRVRGDRPVEFALRVRRSLSCDPASGDYAHPARACRALVQYISLASGGGTCFCALQVLESGRVTGQLRGRHIDVIVDFCSACGHGAAAVRDVRILTPGQSA
jgi:hypothetical protein